MDNVPMEDNNVDAHDDGLDMLLQADHDEVMLGLRTNLQALRATMDHDGNPFDALSYIALTCNAIAVKNGFWDEAILDTPEGKVLNADARNFGEMIALVHSELSEALEAHRGSLKDDKLPQYDGVVVEAADAIIRLLDMAVAHNWPLLEAIIDKLIYNTTRPFKHGKKY